MKKRHTLKRRGFMSISGVLFYSMSFLILLAIPVTVILVRSGQQQSTITQASRNFKASPTLTFTVMPTSSTTGQKFKAAVTLDSANWYSFYYIANDIDIASTGVLMNEIKSRFLGSENLVLMHEGGSSEEFEFALPRSGFVVAVAFQLKNYLADFSSGDIMCAWDGSIYLYRDNVDIINEIIHGEKKPNGEWSKLIKCANSGPLRLNVTN